MGYLFGYEVSIEEEKRLEGLKTVIPVTKLWSYRAFLNLFESMLMGDDNRTTMAQKEMEQADREAAKKAIENLQGGNIQKQTTKTNKNMDKEA